ncbi:AAA domain-containing protein, partial [Actinoplanes sp. NPDC024001]|uniref:AAA domain-containing protein n=1 Tax=Actinoplanes sp. NPDC024001 TaxID=3154598 RepID=UPI0033F997A9
MASTSVDLDHEEGSGYRNDDFCAALEFALAGEQSEPDERVQRDAILRLRTGVTVNPGLLALLAGARYAPAAPHDPADVVQRALGVPDLLCLLAPPGVARTLAVLEIARAAAERGERVLIAAPTSAALDVLVPRLPAGLTVIRTDRGGSGPATLTTAAAETQRKILARSQAAAHALEPWLGDPSPATGWLHRLTTALDEAG